jgi:DNA-binding GntR family transcriptional regulator
MDIQPVEARSLVDVIATQIEQAIFSGTLEPGAKISELGLARQLGVSRGPLREALRRLEGRKLIERKTNFGARVAKLSVDDLEDLLVVREALEGMAARLAAASMTDEDVARLEQLIAQHGEQESVRTGTGYLQELPDFDFHFFIIRAARNERLENLLCGELYDLLRAYRYKSSTLDGRARNAFEEHKEIVSALVARDPDAAEAAMRHHLATARTHILSQMRAARM